MRLCRFEENRLGLVDPSTTLGASGEQIRDVTGALDELPSCRYPFPPGDILVANLEKVAARARALAASAPARPLDGVKLLSPIANPNKIIGAPMNYRTGQDEAAIASAMSIGLFLKANGSLGGQADGIRLRMMERQIDHEVELGVVAVALDITPHGKEERSLRKSCETYTVLGPWLVTADEIPDPMNLNLQLDLNGERKQQGNTRQMIRDVATMIEYASSFYTLYPGDIFLSGTPAGVGPIKPGDEIVASIEKIGTLRARVTAA